MRVHRQVLVSLDEAEQYDAPTRSGRSFRVKQVYATRNSEGVVDHVQESGPLLLLRGGVSVDDHGCARFPKLEELPEAIRAAVLAP